MVDKEVIQVQVILIWSRYHYLGKERSGLVNITHSILNQQSYKCSSRYVYEYKFKEKSITENIYWQLREDVH